MVPWSGVVTLVWRGVNSLKKNLGGEQKNNVTGCGTVVGMEKLMPSFYCEQLCDNIGRKNKIRGKNLVWHILSLGCLWVI